MSTHRLPQKWTQARLGDVAEIVGGGTPSRREATFFDGDIPWATLSDVTKLDGIWISKTEESITPKGLMNSSTQLLPSGTVLMTSRATIGVTAIAMQSMATNQGFANFICNDQVLINEYLAYFLPTIKKQLIGLAGGTTFKEISRTALAKVVIPLPPLVEQQRIVSILHQAYELRRLKKEAERKRERLLLALFYSLFGLPYTWSKTVPLKELVTFVGGGTPNRKVEAYFSGDIPWATSKDIKSRYLHDTTDYITEKAVRESSTNIVPEGTILVVVKSKILLHTLPVGITIRPFSFSQDIKGLIPRENIDPRFIATALLAQSDTILKSARGVNTEGLTLDVLREIPIPDVDIEKQSIFLRNAFIYDDIDEMLIQIDKKLTSLTQALQAQAFTGELTATWREQHQDELVPVVVEQKPEVAEPQPMDAWQTLQGQRKTLLAALSMEQKHLLRKLLQIKGYFTLETVQHRMLETKQDSNSFSTLVTRQGLQLFVTMGLLQAVRVPLQPREDVRVYVLVYRTLTESDQVKEQELKRFTEELRVHDEVGQ